MNIRKLSIVLMAVVLGCYAAAKPTGSVSRQPVVHHSGKYMFNAVTIDTSTRCFRPDTATSLDCTSISNILIWGVPFVGDIRLTAATCGPEVMANTSAGDDATFVFVTGPTIAETGATITFDADTYASGGSIRFELDEVVTYNSSTAWAVGLRVQGDTDAAGDNNTFTGSCDWEWERL